MNRHWTDGELEAELKKLSFVIDRREQKNEWIEEYCDKHKIPVIHRKLDVGDYACQLGDITFENDFVVERKADLDEICGNLTADRDRFEREFLRAKAHGIKAYLLIENGSWQDIMIHNYHSKLSPKSLLASLLAWQTRFNVTIIFCPKDISAAIIHGIFHYAAREVLLYGATGAIHSAT